MRFYAIKDSYVLTQSVVPFEPWTYNPSPEDWAQITAQIRHDKDSRQAFYQNVNTRWNFYTPLEGCNPHQRVSLADNPPRRAYGFSADNDIPLPKERIKEIIDFMTIKPAWIETSLGGNNRFVWVFPESVRLDSTDFCIYFFRAAIKWLRLDLLPFLDTPAFLNPTRMLCNGGVWESTGHGPIPMEKLQAFYVSVCRSFDFKSSDPAELPLDLVEQKAKEKYPDKFNWPGPFELESMGPSFWIEGSTSPKSAIVKKHGMISFAAHAEKTFYPYSDILGKDFVKQFADNAIAQATKDIFWDHQKFYQNKGGVFEAIGMPELLNYFEITCGLSSKPDKTGKTPIKEALNHIYRQNYVSEVTPHMFRPTGMIEFQGRRVLNNYINRAIKPADVWTPWGPDGAFPFSSEVLDNLFDPQHQLYRFLAWWKRLYLSALYLKPCHHQIVYLLGGVGTGKTVTAQLLVGASLGGSVDAAEKLIEGAAFTHEFMVEPLWMIDDDVGKDDPRAQTRFQTVLKKTSANERQRYNKKYQSAGMGRWNGGIIICLNVGFVSSRPLGAMDNNSRDKTNVFRCAETNNTRFGTDEENAEKFTRELPNLLRWLHDWEVPQDIPRHRRFGYASYQEPSLLRMSYQNSRCAPFKELVIQFLREYWAQNPMATEWRGSATALLCGFQTLPGSDIVVRSMRLDQTIRFLEQIKDEGKLKCRTEDDDMEQRVWVFERFGSPAKPPQEIPPLVTNNNQNQNDK